MGRPAPSSPSTTWKPSTSGVRYIDTPRIPHRWDAGVLHTESTGALLCGDLFTRPGDIVGPAIATEDPFRYSSLNPTMEPRSAASRRLPHARSRTAMIGECAR
jgi:hypothetical protein